MSRPLHALTFVTLATWLAFLLYLSFVLASLSRLDAPMSEMAPALLLPWPVMTLSVWVGFRSPKWMPRTVAIMSQVALTAFGLLLLASAALPRT